MKMYRKMNLLPNGNPIPPLSLLSPLTQISHQSHHNYNLHSWYAPRLKTLVYTFKLVCLNRV